MANGNISEDDYEHAKKVFDVFGCQNMLQYTEMYCKLDTFLLCIAFTHFRDEVREHFDLDCAHYISLPSLAFDGMLKVRCCQNYIINGITNIFMRV